MGIIESSPETSRRSQHYCIEGFKEGPQLGMMRREMPVSQTADVGFTSLANNETFLLPQIEMYEKLFMLFLHKMKTLFIPQFIILRKNKLFNNMSPCVLPNLKCRKN